MRLPRLAAWAPAAPGATVAMNVLSTGAGWEAWRFELAALNLVALALLVPVVLAWARHPRRRLLVASGCATVLAVILIYLATVRPSDIPIDWITIIHEGLGYQNILHLYTNGVHAGANFKFVVAAVAAGPVPNLHDVVWLNLLLALINAVIFLHLAMHVTGLLWALVWTLVFALNPATFQGSFSELPTNLLALYFLAGVIAWVTLNDQSAQPRVIRAAAYLLCVVLTLLVGLTRSEVAFIGVLALTLHAGYILLGPDTWSALGQRLRLACQRPLAFLADHPAAVAVLCVLSVWLTQAGLPGLGRSECAGLYPFNPSIFSLYVFLPMLLLPIGVSIAVLFGFMHSIIHFRRFGGLALSLFVLVRTYFAAQNEFFEAGRYLSYILPAIFLLGLFGKPQFDEMVRSWSPNWRRAVAIAYVMTWFTRPPPGAPEFYLRFAYDRSGGFSQVLLDRNTQREVRHLLTVTEKNPQCVFVGRVVESFNHPDLPPQYAYAVFGGPVAQPIFVSEKGAKLDDVIARFAAGAVCARLYYGGDCNLTYLDHCTEFVAGRQLVDEERFWSRPFNNQFDFGYGAPEIVLATYTWP